MGKTAVLAVKILGDAKGAQDAFTDVESGAGGLMGTLGKIGPAAALVGGAIAAGVVAGGKALYDIGAIWDDVADGIRVGTGATGEVLDGLMDSAKNVASTIPAAIEDIGPVIADLNTRMGLTGKTLDTVASQYLEAGRMLGETVDIQATSAAFNAFGIEGEGVVKGMDQLFQVSQATGVGMNDLAAIITKAGPGLTNLGFSFADSAALAGSLDKAGLDASATMTAMQKGMVTLARAGEEPQAAFQRVVGEIDGFIKAGDTAGAINLASKVFGTKGAAQFVTAVQSGTIGVEDLMGAAGTTTDTILGLGQETADAAEKWQILKNKALVALEPIASAVFGGAGAALDWLLNLVNTFDWSTFTAGFGGVTSTFSGFMPMVEQLANWFNTSLRPAIEAFAQSAAERFTAVKTIISDFVAGAMEYIGPLMPQIQDTFTTIGTIISDAVALITEIWNIGTAAILSAWELVGPPIINVVGAIFKAITGIIGPALDVIKGVIKTVLSVIRGDWSGAWDGIKGIVDGAWRLIKGIVDGALGIIKGLISGAVSIITGLWSRGWDGFKSTLSTAWEGMKTATSAGINAITDFFRGLPGKITGALSGLSSRLYDMGANMIRGMINGVRDMAGNLVSAAKNVVNDAVTGAKNALGIRSPSRVFAEIGMWTGQGLIQGLDGQASAVARAGDRLANAAVPDVPAFDLNNPFGSNANRGVLININGALDPLAVARQIRDVLNHEARFAGRIALNATVGA